MRRTNTQVLVQLPSKLANTCSTAGEKKKKKSQRIMHERRQRGILTVGADSQFGPQAGEEEGAGCAIGDRWGERWHVRRK